VLRRLVRFAFRHRRPAQRVLRWLVPRPVLVGLDGFRLYVRLDDWAIGARIAVKRAHEAHVTRVMTGWLKPGQTVIDVGANIGYYTLLAASRVGPSGRVLAFEPSAANCALLKASLRANGFTNVSVYNQAAADANGRLAFDMDDSNGGVSRALSPGRTLVEAVALDQCLAAEPRVDLIKLDVEGAEGLVLRGMRQLVRRHRPVLFTEFSPAGLAAISGLSGEAYLGELRGLGYELFALPVVGGPSAAPQTDAQILESLAAAGSDHLDLLAIPAA
jgi:FkbM family methyltransferase